MGQSPNKSLVFPLLVAGLAGAVLQAPPRIAVWLVILSVVAALLAGLALTCLFLLNMAAETWSFTQNWPARRRQTPRPSH